MNQTRVAALIGVALVLYAVASLGMMDIAGFSEVYRRWAALDWPWLVLSALCVVAGLVAYRFAWDGIGMAGDAPSSSSRDRFAAAMAGFGTYLLRGGSTVDRHMFRCRGLSRRQSDVRIMALDALEHAPMAVGCFVLGIVIIWQGQLDPPPRDFVWPWVLATPIGAALAVWATMRFRERWRESGGLVGRLGIALDSVFLVWQMVVGRNRGLPLVAMGLFWIAEIASLWSAMAAFGYSMDLAPLVFAYVVGYVVTRRPAPLGGAGLLDLFLPLCLWDCGAPLAAAVAGSIPYRFFSLWLPLPLALRETSYVVSEGGRNIDEPEPALRNT